MKRGDTDRMARPAAAVAPLDEVLVGEQRDGGQRAADALGRVLGGDDALFFDDLAPYPERLVQHQVDLVLGFGAAGDSVELHDDAVLRRVVWDGVADGRRDGLAGRFARPQLRFSPPIDSRRRGKQILSSIYRGDTPMQEKSACREPRRR